MIAAYEGNLESLKFLVETFQQLQQEGEEMKLENWIDKLGNTILHYASWGGKLQCIQYCIESCHMDPFQVNQEGMNSLQFASAGNHVDCLIYLEQQVSSTENQSSIAKPQVFAEGKSESTIAGVAVVGGFGGMSESGLTSFHRACLHGAVDIVKHLLQQIQQDNETKYSPYLNKETVASLPTPLQDQSSLATICQLYFTSGIYARTLSGNTALHLSTQNNSLEIVTLLLNHMRSEQQKFPLFYLDMEAQQQLEKGDGQMIHPKIGIDIQNTYGLTPLHFACIG
jgi:ankyrin repeat protein